MDTVKSQVLQAIKAKARARPRRIALPEAGLDARVLHAAVAAATSGLAVPVLYGSAQAIREFAASEGVALDGLEVVDPQDHLAATAAAYRARRAGKEVLTERQLEEIAADPLYCAALHLAAGEVDGLVSGAAATTAAVVRAAIRCVGTRPGISTVSSFFLMLLPPESPLGAQALLFADCAVVAEPTPAQLADIAITTADVGGELFGIKPRIAMLSFSTRGSAQHEKVTAVRDATALVRERRPDLECDGEMQLDAAVIPAVSERKAPGSALGGRANILVFPDLDSGNIGYKLVQRIGHADAVGPILQGLARPVSDLSRGCSVQDVVDAIALTAAQV